MPPGVSEGLGSSAKNWLTAARRKPNTDRPGKTRARWHLPLSRLLGVHVRTNVIREVANSGTLMNLNLESSEELGPKSGLIISADGNNQGGSGRALLHSYSGSTSVTLSGCSRFGAGSGTTTPRWRLTSVTDSGGAVVQRTLDYLYLGEDGNWYEA